MPTSSFQLSPADVEFRYRLLQLIRLFNPRADDPLFRPIDADDFRVNGDQASDFSNLRKNGLVRIVFPLPPNVRLIDPGTNLPSAEASVDVWRSVPSVLNVALSGPGSSNPWPREPNAFGGYQLDARVGTLQEQALGAFVNHAQVQELPAQRLLDDLSSFQRTLFTRPQVSDLADAIRAGSVSLPDPDPPLNALEQQGKAVFHRACAQCHGGVVSNDGAGADSPLPGHPHAVPAACRYGDTGAIRIPGVPAERLARNARTYEITLNATTTLRRTSSDPGRRC